MCLGDGFNVDNVALASKEDLCFGVSAIKGRRAGVNFIGKDIVVEAMDVECGIWCVKPSEEVSIR